MKEKMLELLKQEVVPAIGCTEPTAVAYAVAKAVEVLGKEADKLLISLSGNVLKNGMSVGIPGTGMVGINIAACLGAVVGDASKVLEILDGVTKQDIKTAKEKLDQGLVEISIAKVPNKLYIEVIAQQDEDYSKVVIKDFHTAITLIEKNGEILLKGQCDEVPTSDDEKDRNFMSIDKIYNLVTTVDLSEIEFMDEAITLNEAIAKEGLKMEYGLKVGKTRAKNIRDGILTDDVENTAIVMTAAAADARMDGAVLPVMTNSGSGNQGITATVPVIAAGIKMGVSREKLIRAVTLSNLIAVHIKGYLGSLSALCGCVVASTGASCGISYLMGGKLDEIKSSIKNMLGNISGMFCDGAKPGCAVKIATGVSAAVQAALLAKDHIEIHETEGVVDKCAEQTIKNVCKIGREAMNETDKMILDIMVSK